MSAPVATTASRTSLTFPEPIKVAESGLSRRWIKASITCDPAVSANAANSLIELSASLALPSVHTPTNTTFSNRN